MKMPNYSKSQIYEISYDGYYYIGSTTQTLNNRFSEHKSRYKRWKSGKEKFKPYKACEILEKCFDCHRHTIEFYPCKNKKELEAKERQYIEKYKKLYGEKCLNKKITNATKEDKRKNQRIFYHKNIDKMKLKCKKYRENNKETETIRYKKYREKNKIKISQNSKRLRIYQNSWCGDKRFNNNLLEINPTIYL